jgi:hypothetical protein
VHLCSFKRRLLKSLSVSRVVLTRLRSSDFFFFRVENEGISLYQQLSPVSEHETVPYGPPMKTTAYSEDDSDDLDVDASDYSDKTFQDDIAESVPFHQVESFFRKP